jgi:ribosome biogenesis GTP-binding protein YsxC/EngB
MKFPAGNFFVDSEMAAVTPFLATYNKALWLTPQRMSFANTLLSGRIDIHPVIVKETMYRLPFSLIPQVAFVGRSNVGKSSLINALLHGREVARPSPLPGRTRQLFTFDVGESLSLVDLPGYGFAGKIARSERDEWHEMMKLYISNANGLERIVSLIDCRHGVKRADEDFWKSLVQLPIHPKRKAGPQVVVTLTKTDLVEKSQLEKTIKATIARLDHFKKAEGLRVWPFLHAVSSETGDGISELRSALCSMCPLTEPNKNDAAT